MTTSDVRAQLERAIYDSGRLVNWDQAYEIAAAILAEFDVSAHPLVIGPHFGDETASTCECGHPKFDHSARRGACLPIHSLGRNCWCRYFRRAEPQETKT